MQSETWIQAGLGEPLNTNIDKKWTVKYANSLSL